MGHVYRPRGMPRRFLETAPEIVRKSLIDILGPFEDSVCDFDVILRPEPDAVEIVGLDFDRHGAQGCHFFLKPHEARDYRARNRRKRVAWADLPEPTRRRIVGYLESD